MQTKAEGSDVLTAFIERLIQYWHVNNKGVHRELILTQSLVSELITTSLWAKNPKGFLAYHCFSYREKTSHRSLTVWEQNALSGIELYSLSARYMYGILTKTYCNTLLLPLIK